MLGRPHRSKAGTKVVGDAIDRRLHWGSRSLWSHLKLAHLDQHKYISCLSASLKPLKLNNILMKPEAAFHSALNTGMCAEKLGRTLPDQIGV